MDKVYDFENALALARKREDANTIGVLGEKTLHAVLKYMFCDDESCHEQKYCGFVADVFTTKNERPVVYEIQTRQTFKLKRKLTAYGDTETVVVLPVLQEKNIIWKDPFGEKMSKPHKSSRPQNVFCKIAELYGIREFLERKNISYIIPVMKATEYKLLDGWSKDKKKGATKLDTVPDALIDIFSFESSKDFYDIFPFSSGEMFTAKDFAEIVHISMNDARNCILVYKQLGIVEEYSKQDRKKVWKVIF